jgi:hypothetical protein
MGMSTYNGYLANHVELIRALHQGGASTLAIAETLYATGARAQTSSPYSTKMSRAAHLTNLRAMTIFILQRLGLRHRRVRVLNLRATEIETAPADETGAVGSSIVLMMTRPQLETKGRAESS